MRRTASGRVEFIDAAAAASLVGDGATIGIEASGGGVLEPDALIGALGRRFSDTGSPRDLTLFFCSGIGDGAGGGVDRLAQPGLLGRVIGAHFRLSPALAALAERGEIEAYNLPQGVLAQLLREIGAGRPGLITKTGLGTFVDPRVSGGKVNDRTGDDLVELLMLDGEEWLRYRPHRFDVMFLRGTTVDADGNLTAEREAARLSLTSAAIAARNTGATVVVQAQRRSSASLDPRLVVVPGHLVDYVVLSPGQWQTAASAYNPAFSGEVPTPLRLADPLPLDERKVVGRRAFAELEAGFVVNLGVGMADSVAAIAEEEGALGDITLSIEQGLVGGMPARGLVFGASWNPKAIIDQNVQFDFYDGGGLDVACLGFAQADRAGNVNVSRIGGRMFGTGGFINISQSARKVVFCGSFTTGGLQVDVGGGRLQIVREGRYRKFPDAVDQITFNAGQASGREILYVTERAVFGLTHGGLELREVAPGIDLEHEILALMDFEPILSDGLTEMDPALFS